MIAFAIRRTIVYSSSGVEVVHPKPHAPPHRLAWAGASDVGLQRTRNEDRYGAFSELGLFLVADGMGGAAGGEIAAQMAVDLVCEMFADPDATFPGSGPPGPGGAGFLIAAIERANSRIHGIHVATLTSWVKHGIIKAHAYNSHAWLYEEPAKRPRKHSSRWDRLSDRAAAIRAPRGRVQGPRPRTKEV
jgi:hypothetical protein